MRNSPLALPNPLLRPFSSLPGKPSPGCNFKSQGFGLATNVSYSFFYVLTVALAVHLLGGLGGLVRVISKLNHSVLKRKHFECYFALLAFQWVRCGLYLLLLLWMKL